MSRRTRKNIGLIGLGLIGNRVREVLRRKGFQVFVWNRTPRTVPNFVGAPAELAEMCDFIQIFVSDDDALLYVVKQLSPALAARHIVIAHPTVSPQTMISAAEIVQRRGARFMEAPFTGSKEAAEKGELVYYAGGDKEVLAEAHPLLQASSKEILDIGEIGQATAIKVATNMVTAASVQAAAEALALVQASGLSAEKFTAAMLQNASNSKTLSMKLPKMVEQNFERHFSVQHMLKDMQIATRLGLTHHLELGVTAAARDRLLEQVQKGHGDEDYSAVARKYTQDPAGRHSEAELELFQRRNAPATPAAQSAPAKSEEPKPAAAQSVTAPSVVRPVIAEPPKAIVEQRKVPAEPTPQPVAASNIPNVPVTPEKMSTPAEAVATAPEHARSAAQNVGAAAETIAASSTGSALEALQAHAPAAPFLNPVQAAETADDRNEQPEQQVPAQNAPDFLSEARESVVEPEAPPARGFFSKLLRRADS